MSPASPNAVPRAAPGCAPPQVRQLALGRAHAERAVTLHELRAVEAFLRAFDRSLTWMSSSRSTKSRAAGAGTPARDATPGAMPRRATRLGLLAERMRCSLCAGVAAVLATPGEIVDAIDAAGDEQPRRQFDRQVLLQGRVEGEPATGLRELLPLAQSPHSSNRIAMEVWRGRGATSPTARAQCTHGAVAPGNCLERLTPAKQRRSPTARVAARRRRAGRAPPPPAPVARNARASSYPSRFEVR